MMNRLHARNHYLGLVHGVEGMFLTAGMLLSTLVTLVAVYFVILFLGR
ncbi:MAG: hypothetical protein LAP40_18910 [Acidobacteriia bacterium]|nr:hypothetical protein [Terriglobia bacterium]